jgi:hypothetical protein
MNILFNVTTMGENQAPARHLFTKARAQKYSLVGQLSMEGGATSLPTEWKNCGCVSGSWVSRVKRVNLDSGIMNSTSLRTSSAGELQTKTKAGSESKKLTRAWPNRNDCRRSAHRTSFGAHFFAPCITWLLVLDLTCVGKSVRSSAFVVSL